MLDFFAKQNAKRRNPMHAKHVQKLGNKILYPHFFTALLFVACRFPSVKKQAETEV